ncbi:unnamed protein product [Didymodactylos carnosus]|uniref:Uncharacterized protein n=1 Tax=Didymodactylos carnosus TaxID=1234261 RepID=A0A814HNQ8_9BILA|nr:unnamed protein product [Didymodactylos carnosus]CAF3784662.1 unnamed protein product [Didymodactylos carnosus]
MMTVVVTMSIPSKYFIHKRDISEQLEVDCIPVYYDTLKWVIQTNEDDDSVLYGKLLMDSDYSGKQVYVICSKYQSDDSNDGKPEDNTNRKKRSIVRRSARNANILYRYCRLSGHMKQFCLNYSVRMLFTTGH